MMKYHYNILDRTSFDVIFFTIYGKEIFSLIFSPFMFNHLMFLIVLLALKTPQNILPD